MKLSTEQRMQAYRVLIGEALAEQRKTKKLSQQAVADKTGTSRVSISYYENGLRSINTDELFTLCTACGFDAVKIMNNAYNASDGELQKAYTKYFDRAMSLKEKEKPRNPKRDFSAPCSGWNEMPYDRKEDAPPHFAERRKKSMSSLLLADIMIPLSALVGINFMPVYKDKNGTWYYSIQRKDPITGKYKHLHKRGFATKKEATKALMALEMSTAAKSSATVREMIVLWEDHNQSSKQTRQKHKEHFERRFTEYLDKPIDSLSKPILSRWRANLAENDKYSTTTKNRTITYVKSLLRFAHDVYDIPTNTEVLKSLEKTDEEALKEAEKEMMVWTPAEFAQFQSCVEDEVYSLFFEFLFWTGCRRGEAIALQKKDFNNHQAMIRYSQRSQKEGLKPTKKRAIRSVALDDVTWDHLMPLTETEGSYLFGGLTGLPPETITRKFKKAIAESGVKRITVHSLRHSHASWLINNGVNILAVSKRLGHKDVSTTLRVYTHLLEQTDNDMMGKLNSYRK